jgi:hypothetical protein
MSTSASAELIRRAAGPVSVWLVGRMLDVPRVKKALRRVDATMLRTAVKKRHVVPRRLWRVAFGLGLVVAGAVMIARGRRGPAE